MSEPEEFKKITNAYNAAISLWRLASEQIYSRFGAMLIGNSIIVAILGGLVFKSELEIPQLSLVLPFLGIGLCILWFLFIWRGLQVEDRYRKIAETLESRAIPDDVKVAFPTGTRAGFDCFSYVTIAIFVFLYIIIFLLLLTRAG